MWQAATATEAFREAIAGAGTYRQRMLRLFGIPESEIAETLRVAERRGVALDQLEITTCLRRGEVEVVTRYTPEEEAVYESFEGVVRERHPDTLFSADGSSVDDQVAQRLRSGGQTIAVAESCTGGLVCARLTALAGSSEYVVGGLVVYSDQAKIELAGVPAELISRHGAVSGEVAQALASGVADRLRADVGVGVTGIAGPGGGSDEKPVGLVWFSVADRSGRRLTRRVHLPGGREDVRDRSTTVALHLVRRLLLGEADDDRRAGESVPGTGAAGAR